MKKDTYAIGGSYVDKDGHVGRHQTTEKGQEYVKFSVLCEYCKEVIFEFVHQQRPLTYSDKILAIPNSDEPYGAQSWFKPAMRPVCMGKEGHRFVPLNDEDNRNIVCRSQPMTHSQFRGWKEDNV